LDGDHLAPAKDAHLKQGLRQCLVEDFAFEREIAVVDSDEGVAAHQDDPELLFRLLSGFALAHDNGPVAGREDRRDFDDHALAATSDRRVHAMQRREVEGAPRNGSHEGREGDAFILRGDEIVVESVKGQQEAV
jgi:hypothetical protein